MKPFAGPSLVFVCAAAVGLGGCNSSSTETPAAGSGGTTQATGGAPATGGTVGAATGGAPAATGGAGGSGGATDAPPLNPVGDHGHLQVVGTQLQDEHGAPVQLKGVSSQWLNYESGAYPESKSAIQWARDHWKLSVIRAAMGVDANGGYLGTTATNANPTLMLSKVQTIIQNAIDLGIYVIVDWHTSNAVKANSTTTQASQASDFFTMIAQTYGDQPNIIYEDFNEPTNVTWAQVKPYHETVVAAIRAVDPDNVIVLGTPTWSQDVDLAAQDPVAGTNLMYTLHFYSCTHKQPIRDKGTTALGLGLPIFITEFGATPADGGVVKSGDPYVCEAEANSWFTWMAQNNISGVAWKLDTCSDTSCILGANATPSGPWTDDALTSDAGGTPVSGGVQPPAGGGHGQFVVNWIRQ